jgi:hypothetical protein
MKPLAPLPFILLVGCGPAFTERDFFAPHPDSGSSSKEATTNEATIDAGGGVDAGMPPPSEDAGALQTDVGLHPEAPDASSETVTPLVDAAPDVAPDAGVPATCTPFPSDAMGVACGLVYSIPKYIGGWYNNRCVGIVQNTPPQCMCKETYNCECFKAAGICKSNFSCNSLYGAPQLASCNDNLPQGTP